MRARPGLLFAFVCALTLGAIQKSPSYFVHEKWIDLRFPISSLSIGVGNPPTFVSFSDDGAGSVGVFTAEFSDQGVAGNEIQAIGVAQLPHGYKEESPVDFHYHWELEDATDCHARLCIEYNTADTDTPWAANTTIACADCPSGAGGKDLICNVDTITMTDMDISALVSFRTFRNSSHANDTCDGKDVWIHTSDFHIIVNTRGALFALAK